MILLDGKKVSNDIKDEITEAKERDLSDILKTVIQT